MKKYFFIAMLVIVTVLVMIASMGCANTSPEDSAPSGEQQPSGNIGSGNISGGSGEIDSGEIGDTDASEDEWNGDIDYSLVYVTDGEGVITGMTDYGLTLTHIVIPAELGDEVITEIGDSAFRGNLKLKKVRFEPSDYAVKLAASSFRMCLNLVSLELSASVSSIANTAFYQSSENLDISVDEENATYYSEENCLIEKETKTLVLAGKTETIPNGVEIIDKYSFALHSGIKSIAIPQSVTKINGYAFHNCTALRQIYIPNSVTNIVAYAFSECAGATLYCETATVPSGYVTSWNRLSSLQLLEYVLDYKNNDVDNSGYINYYDENGIHYLLSGGKAIVGLQSRDLVNMYIKSSISYGGEIYNVTSIDARACWKNTILADVFMPAGLISIGNDAFLACSNLQRVMFESNSQLLSIELEAFKDCVKLQSIELPNTLEKINRSAFQGCASLQSIIIPLATKLNGSSIFSGCTSMQVIYCEVEEAPDTWTTGWNPDNIEVIYGYSAA